MIFRQIFTFLDKYLQTNGVYMRASGITLVSGPLVTVTPQYTPIAPTTAKDGRGSFIQNTKGRTNTKGRLNCMFTLFLAKTIIDDDNIHTFMDFLTNTFNLFQAHIQR